MNEADAVREWLGRTGYPLESEVAKAFRAEGLQVFQGLHYGADNAEASGAREIDVLAVCEELVSRHPITRCTVIFVIECKTSSVPWVVFRSQSKAERWGAIGRRRMNAITQVNLLAALEWEQQPWLLSLPANVGFRLGALATKQRASGTDATRDWDQAYAAVKQVVSAVQGVLRSDPSHLPTIAVPVIVLGTRLFAVSYDDDGHEEVMPSSWERILWEATVQANQSRLTLWRRTSSPSTRSWRPMERRSSFRSSAERPWMRGSRSCASSLTRVVRTRLFVASSRGGTRSRSS